MKKLLLLVILALAGCTGLPRFDLNTTVSRNTLVGVMSAYGVVLSGERAYKALCINHTLARAQCGPIVARLQAADKKAISAIDAAIDFTTKFPTVDAGNFISAASSAVGSLESILASTQ